MHMHRMHARETASNVSFVSTVFFYLSFSKSQGFLLLFVRGTAMRKGRKKLARS